MNNANSFALRTFFCSNSVRFGRPRGLLLSRNCRGAGAPCLRNRAGMGLSLARLPVPQGSAMWIDSGLNSRMMDRRHCWGSRSHKSNVSVAASVLWTLRGPSTGKTAKPASCAKWLKRAQPEKISTKIARLLGNFPKKCGNCQPWRWQNALAAGLTARVNSTSIAKSLLTPSWRFLGLVLGQETAAVRNGYMWCTAEA